MAHPQPSRPKQNMGRPKTQPTQISTSHTKQCQKCNRTYHSFASTPINTLATDKYCSQCITCEDIPGLIQEILHHKGYHPHAYIPLDTTKPEPRPITLEWYNNHQSTQRNRSSWDSLTITGTTITTTNGHQIDLAQPNTDLEQ